MIPGKLYRMKKTALPFWPGNPGDSRGNGIFFKRGAIFMFLVAVKNDDTKIVGDWYKFIAPNGEVLGRYLHPYGEKWFEPVVVTSR